MKDFIIDNQYLTVSTNPFGAELKSVFDTTLNLEYVWQGDEDTFLRSGYTMFPSTGRLVNNIHYVHNKAYEMPENGFTHTRNFSVVEHKKDSITMCLVSDDRTRRYYPYDFSLSVTYSLRMRSLSVSYLIENLSEVNIPVGVGCHVAFRWPLYDYQKSTDYYLNFEKEEKILTFNPFGWTDPFLKDESTHLLYHDLFSNYARSFHGLRSEWLELRSTTCDHFIRIHRKEFPFLAMWGLPSEEASFICLEPCTSIATGGTTLFDRAGILSLPAHRRTAKTFKVDFL